ncbi:MAG: 5-oxoprolinase subunit B family protein [Ornithinibacter sp.]
MTGHDHTPGPATSSATGGLDVTLLPVGEEGLLLEVADLAAVLALEAAIRTAVEAGTSPWHDVTDVVPAARTVLLLTREGADLPRLATAVRRLPDPLRPTHGSEAHPSPENADRSHEVEVLVRYAGPDLDDIAALTGLTTAEVIAAHTSMPWRVAFGGFAPGFAYLVGGDPRLHVPRRERPRPSVPAGSVGLAGEFSGVYPRSSPGGWQLLGTTDAVLWDAERDPPALLGPGTTVRFVDAATTT